MSFRTAVLSINFLLTFCQLKAEELRLRIIDKNSQETIAGVSISNIHQHSGAVSDYNGQAIFNLQEGIYDFAISFLGYQTDTFQVTLHNDTLITYYMQEVFNKLSTIEVIGQKFQRDDGVIGISKTLLDKMPVFFGEKELVKAIQLLPGVQSGSEGSTNIFVRGGMADQNLITIDDVPIYNLNHLFGILSIFNSDFISVADLYKNYLPARYSGRITSALAVKTKTPSYTDTHFGFQMGMINSRVYVETPLVKNKLSTQIGVRGFYAGIFIKPISKTQYKTEDEKGSIGYFFYDINSSLHYKINKKNSLAWSLFYTGDRYKTIEEGSKDYEYNWYGNLINFKRNSVSVLKWRNIISSLQHRYEINDHLFFQQKVFVSQFRLVKSYLSYRDYFDKNGKLTDQESSDKASFVDLTDVGYIGNIDWSKNKSRWTNGVRIFNRFFTPNKFHLINTMNQGIRVGKYFNDKRISTQDINTYSDYNLKLNHFNLSLGLAFNLYHNDDYLHASILPGASVEWKLPKSTTLQLSGNITQQNLHMLYGSTTDVMNDVWVPATKRIPSQKAYQGSFSYRQELKTWSWSVETFYRAADNQIEYVDRDLSDDRTDWQNQMISGGKGRAYGLELYLNKQVEKWNFTATYNLSKSEKKFKTLNRGRWYPFTYDRRHDVYFFISYSPNKKWNFTASWIYGTGRPYTMPDVLYPGLEVLGYYNSDEVFGGFHGWSDKQVQYFEKRNNKRLQSFHHLDIGMNYKWTKNKWNQAINVSIYNVYNRKNVFSLYFNNHIVAEKRIDYSSLTLLPFMPSFSYSVEF
ncbi:MAG: TonB-dependent receptor [Chitinophagales bacterium]|nr:TonB-dependent receptor [Chitinophagales bacterium]